MLFGKGQVRKDPEDGALIQLERFSILVCRQFLFIAVLSTVFWSGVGPVSAQPAAQDPLAAAFARMMAQPGNANSALAYARLAAERGQTRAAITALERALRYNPRQDSLRLELASLHMAAGSPDIAALYAQEALASSDIPPDVAARARTLLAGAERGSARSVLEASLFAGARYDSNATQATTLSTVSVFSPQLGIVSVTPGNRGRSDASFVLTGQLAHRLDLGLQREGAWETNVLGFRQDFAQAQHDYDLTLLTFDTGPRIGVATFGDAMLAIRPFVAASFLGYGSYAFSTPYGGGLSAELRLPPRWTLEASAQGRYGRYYNSNFRPTVSLYSGTEYTVSLAASYTPAPSVRLSATAFYYDASARADFYNRHGPGITLAALANFSVFGIQAGGLVRAGVRQVSYGGPDPFIDPTRTRDDTIYDAGASLVIPIAAGFSGVLQYDYVRQRSPYGIYSFNNHAVTAGLRFNL